jgi:hypothetical protein
VAAYAGIELMAAEVLDRDDVKWGRPVYAMRQCIHRTVNARRLGAVYFMVTHVE